MVNVMPVCCIAPEFALVTDISHEEQHEPPHLAPRNSLLKNDSVTIKKCLFQESQAGTLVSTKTDPSLPVLKAIPHFSVLMAYTS